ncbi:MAG: zinc-binding dehydrogenase [Polyangiaceae bacterium]|nr:zinc-binding dehydrogenase [Polyangiaceae bacterium]
MRAEAWFLHASATRGLVREPFDLPEPADDEVVAEPLFGAWEGNMGHAVLRRPIDVCAYRGEPRVILGNAGVVRVLRAGGAGRRFQPGDVAIVFSGCEADAHGYPQKIWAYDAPRTMGCLATRINIAERNLIRVPEGTRHSLAQWAAFAVRYITAWSSWSLAHGTYRLMVDARKDPAPNVWAWGGGTALATLDLCRRFGGRPVMLSGDDQRLASIRALGVEAVDRRQFGELHFDEEAFRSDNAFRRRYVAAENALLSLVTEKTEGRGVQIFIDNIGGPLLRSTLRALSREGVLATCGWKTGMNVSYLRSVACIHRQQLVHTHYARYDEAVEAVAFAEEHGWIPTVDERVYTFDEVPLLAERFVENRTGMFPIYAINAS